MLPPLPGVVAAPEPPQLSFAVWILHGAEMAPYLAPHAQKKLWSVGRPGGAGGWVRQGSVCVPKRLYLLWIPTHPCSLEPPLPRLQMDRAADPLDTCVLHHGARVPTAPIPTSFFSVARQAPGPCHTMTVPFLGGWGRVPIGAFDWAWPLGSGCWNRTDGPIPHRTESNGRSPSRVFHFTFFCFHDDFVSSPGFR